MATENSPSLHFSFDVGHSSIGWAVLSPGDKGELPHVLGCGVLIFPADDCLASERREYRRQRRHIRATRQRIARIKTLLTHLGVLSREELDAVTSSSPWALAARVLKGGPLLTWPELWDVIRWYAHNRGYDGNRRWSGSPEEEEAWKEDTLKEKNAIELMKKHGTSSMSETICAVLGVDPLKKKLSSHIRFKGVTNAAFPRSVVEHELRQLLRAHVGILPHVNEAFERALLGEEGKGNDDDWKALRCASLRLPRRYKGGLLLGQTVPRFDNRLIAICPVTFQREYDCALKEGLTEEAALQRAQKLAKVPKKETPEFYRFRWAMEVAKIKLHGTTPLPAELRRELDKRLRDQGAFTTAEFKKMVRELTGTTPATDNLDQILLHPDAAKALVLDPVQKWITSRPLSVIWQSLPEDRQRCLVRRLRRGKAVSLAEVVDGLEGAEAVLRKVYEQQSARKKPTKASTSKDGSTQSNYEEWLRKPIKVDLLGGRAPFSRSVMKEVDQFVFSTDRHPMEEGGPLFRSEEIIAAQRQRKLERQINNHLIRHRLLLLDRLHRNLITEYAKGDYSRIKRIAIEVNRDLREFSGMTRKEIEGDFNLRLKEFKEAVKKIEEAGLNPKAGLIRKVRIALDLGWQCPYTGAIFDIYDLASEKVDKDHIIPYSLRPSDSLESLVITFPEVNRMKGQRTALEFIEQDGGKPVPGLPNLVIRSMRDYKDFVEKLGASKGHEVDQKRKKFRKGLLMLPSWTEKSFTPRDLAQTSQLVRLSVDKILTAYEGRQHLPIVVSLPGSVTGVVRKSWNLLGCLSSVCPEISEKTTKTEVRALTHMHHALDAIVIGLTDIYFPKDGGIWELMVKRQLSDAEQLRLHVASRGLYARRPEGRFGLLDLSVELKNCIRQKLSERRVVQHIPADMSGLKADQTVYRVLDSLDSHPNARKLLRWAEKKGIKLPDPNGDSVLLAYRKRKEKGVVKPSKLLYETDNFYYIYDIVQKSKLVGLEPMASSNAKLKRLKAVKVLADNYGLALDPEPTIVRNFRVWDQIKKLKERNDGRTPRMLRKGDCIEILEGKYKGIWMIRSIKLMSRDGIAVSLSQPDSVLIEKRNVLINSLLKNGLLIFSKNNYVMRFSC